MKKKLLVMVLLLGVALSFTCNSWGATIECCCDLDCVFMVPFIGEQIISYEGCQTFEDENSLLCNEQYICSTQNLLWALFYENAAGQCDINLTDDCSFDFLLGSDDPRLDLLRQFRDDVLSQTPEGQELIDLYYELSPAIVQAMKEDEAFKEYAKEMIDGILPLTE